MLRVWGCGIAALLVSRSEGRTQLTHPCPLRESLDCFQSCPAVHVVLVATLKTVVATITSTGATTRLLVAIPFALPLHFELWHGSHQERWMVMLQRND